MSNYNDIVDLIATDDLVKIEAANINICNIFNRSQHIQYAIYAAELALHHFERKFPRDKKPRKALEAAKGLITAGGDHDTYAAAVARNAVYNAHFTTRKAIARAAAHAAYADANNYEHYYANHYADNVNAAHIADAALASAHAVHAVICAAANYRAYSDPHACAVAANAAAYAATYAAAAHAHARADDADDADDARKQALIKIVNYGLELLKQ